MITKAHRQEQLSQAYVQIIAAKCGMIPTICQLDYGVDIILREVVLQNGRHKESGFRVDIQAKTTTGELSGAEVIYDMDRQTYDFLREPRIGTNRILVLLVLPVQESEWIAQSEEQLLLRRCAFWYSLRGLPDSSNEFSVRLKIPRAQVFSEDALIDLFRQINERGTL